jgi:hypothetical protein
MSSSSSQWPLSFWLSHQLMRIIYYHKVESNPLH